MENLKYVNALIGTDNEPRFSNGNIYPVTSMPWGMANWCLQTTASGNWFYNPRHRVMEGIRLTHQPSPWIGDYGQMLFNFTTETGEGLHNTYSSIRPENTVISPDYISVYAQRYQTDIELCPTERGGYFKINCKKEKAFMTLNPFGRFSYEQIDARSIYCTANTTYRWGQMDVDEYFYISFNCDIAGIYNKNNGGIAIELAESAYEVKIATSFVSLTQARQNHINELEGKSFEECRKSAASVWEGLLGKIELEGESEEQKGLFYSCMYRALLYPRKFHEVTAEGKTVHFNPDVKKLCDGVFYTDNGFWDTYRTVYPLLSIICPQAVSDMVEGFVNFYEETGYLPKWLSPGECGLMPGTLIEAVIADAAVKGLVDKDLLKRAYEGMVKNAMTDSGNGIQGRKLPGLYNSLGYLPSDKVAECVNNTLDCAYGDFCISQVAQILGDEEGRRFYLNRSENYKNTFSAKHGFMLGRDSEGNFEEDFSAIRWGGVNCEGGYWQNSFAVYHDIEGLAALHGGEDKLCAKIDELFATPPVFEVGAYKQEIHEMSEMAAADFGQCAISNQPSFHIPWLYTLLGQKQKTAYYTQKLAKEAFFNTVDGFPGDEDNGTTAGWYIFACLGFYPVCPGKDEYVLSAPTVNAKIHLDGGRVFTVKKGEITDDKVIKYSQIVR